MLNLLQPTKLLLRVVSLQRRHPVCVYTVRRVGYFGLVFLCLFQNSRDQIGRNTLHYLLPYQKIDGPAKLFGIIFLS